MQCSESNVLHVACNSSATRDVCALAFSFMQPLPTCNSTAGVCTCPGVAAPAPASAPPSAPTPALALTQLIINTSCSSEHISNSTAIAFVQRHLIFANRFEAAPRAAALVILFYVLAHAAAVPTPRGRLGTAFFWAWVCCVQVQAVYGGLMVAAYSMSIAAFGWQHAACLTEWRHGASSYGLLAFGTLGFQPELLVYLTVWQLYGLLLVEAARVYSVVRRNRDVKAFWVGKQRGGFRFWLQLAAYVPSITAGVAFVVSLAWIFSVAFLGVCLPAVAAIAAMCWAMRRLQRWSAGGSAQRWAITRGLHASLAWLGSSSHEGGLVMRPFVRSMGLLAVSPLVVWGVLLALHVYAGGSAQANTELIALVYQASFKGLTAWDMEIDLLDVSDPLEALQSMLRLPNLGDGPERLMRGSQALLTLGGLVGLLKAVVSAITATLAFCSTVPPNVPTSKLTGDEGWRGSDKVREAIGLPTTARTKLAAVEAFARRSAAAVARPSVAAAVATAAIQSPLSGGDRGSSDSDLTHDAQQETAV